MAAAAFATGEWLRSPSVVTAVGAVVLVLVTGIFARRQLWLLLPLAATAGLLVAAQWNLDRIERAWEGPTGEREQRIAAASGRLNEELGKARLLADSLSRRALALAALPQEAGFAAASRLLRPGTLESGVVVFESQGPPRIWAGRFRLMPRAAGDSVAVQLTPYYAVMEVRRHDAANRTAVGTILLAADPMVPDGGASLAARFRTRTEVGLRLLDPQAAPDISDVFDYTLPTTAGDRVLFSAQLIPPEKWEALARAGRSGMQRVMAALLIALIGAIALAPGGFWRIGLALVPFALTLWAPLGDLLGVAGWFDPAAFTSGVLGPISRAPGPLALSGIGLLLTGRLLRERRITFWLGAPLAGVILIATPFLLAELGRGIAPPGTGSSLELWLVWQVTLFLFGAGLIAVGAGLLRRGAPPVRLRAAPLAAMILAIAAAIGGLVIWQPLAGWPAWYLGLWIAPLIALGWPAERRAELAAIAVIAASLTAVLTWGADRDGKVRAAQEDLAGLAQPPVPGLEAALFALGQSVRQAPPPASRADLYRLWRASRLDTLGLPAVLATFGSDGRRILELSLDELDLPADLVESEVRRMSPPDSVVVRRLEREPAFHHLLLVRPDTGTVVVVGLGPATGLIPPSRVGRLLGARPPGRALYRLTIAPAPSGHPPAAGPEVWGREAHQAVGHRSVTVGGISRDLHAAIELGSYDALIVRGALILLLDGAVLAVLWLLAGLLAGRTLTRPAWIPRLRSYEVRIGIALAVFFLAPTLGFAAWGVGRLRGEVRAGRDRAIEQALRDVLPERAVLPAGEPDLDAGLRVLSERVDADFALYREGRLIASTGGGLLEALGLLAPLMDPDAFHRIVIHGTTVTTTEGPSRAVDIRVGYRALRLTDLGPGILALPQTGFDPVLEERQGDLAMVFALVTILGIVASWLAAHAAARSLSRPVAELQRAALAFGEGRPVILPAEPATPEFAPVFAAFDKMTTDVRKAQEAQERAARIVAWGEMASQVAHEIKNPLTPMRLGVQHLRRVFEDGHTPIGPVLESTTGRILAEIDRLDRIARSFSRFGVPASERGPLETVRLPSVVRDVAELYRLGPEGAEVVVEVEDPQPAAARADEVKEALVNLLENSRNAGARTIRVRVSGATVSIEDDGRGIPATLLPMIFEPRFSTSTSGSGLGLPIVKRLVESWGGQVEVESQEGKGTVVRLRLQPAGPAGPGPASLG